MIYIYKLTKFNFLLARILPLIEGGRWIANMFDICVPIEVIKIYIEDQGKWGDNYVKSL